MLSCQQLDVKFCCPTVEQVNATHNKISFSEKIDPLQMQYVYMVTSHHINYNEIAVECEKNPKMFLFDTNNNF